MLLYRWDVNDTRVVCRQFGFPEEGKKVMSAFYGGEADIVFAEVFALRTWMD